MMLRLATVAFCLGVLPSVPAAQSLRGTNDSNARAAERTQGQLRALRITEVDPQGDFVEVTNFGPTFTLDGTLAVAHRDQYEAIPGGTVFEAGVPRVFAVSGLDDVDSDVWLVTAVPAASGNVLHGVKYGPEPDVGLTAEACLVGRWDALASFVTAPTASMTLGYDGAGFGPFDWYCDLTPSLGETDPVADGRDPAAIAWPSGRQGFEGLLLGDVVSAVEGWSVQGASPSFNARVVEGAVPGSPQALLVHDQDASGGANGVHSPAILAPETRNYRWRAAIRLDTAPPSASAQPALAVQHDSMTGFATAFGISMEPGELRLFVTDLGGDPLSVPLVQLASPTGVGDWMQVELEASFKESRVTATVNGVHEASLPFHLDGSAFPGTQRLYYDGNGFGNTGRILIDEVAFAAGAADCRECVTLGFETDDDFLTPLVNGQDISSPEEFGNLVSISSSGANLGAAIFDSDPAGPNQAGDDPDLLVDLGNILILQWPAFPAQSVAGIFDEPNDSREGGTITFDFASGIEPESIALIDICPGEPLQDALVTLTDGSARTRVYDVPAGWTTDVFSVGPPGYGRLGLQTLLPQPGFVALATAVEDAGFDAADVVRIDVFFSSSGGLDDLTFCLPCTTLDFETDDGGVPLVDGQDISTPPEFGNLVAVNGSGPNFGAAIFDSDTGGPNDPGADDDLLVDLGNIIILQENGFQSVAGIFDTPDDNQGGGTLTFDFLQPSFPKSVDIVDICPGFGLDNSVDITLVDGLGRERVFDVPSGYTNDPTLGPPGFVLLDLTTLAPQAGFAAVATAVEDPGFDGADVVQMRVDFMASGAIDNLCFCH